MPPANTPQMTPPRSESTSIRVSPSPLDPALASPAEDADGENVRFLRARMNISPQRLPEAASPSHPPPHEVASSSMSPSHQAAPSSQPPPNEAARRRRLLRDLDGMERMNRTRNSTTAVAEDAQPIAQSDALARNDTDNDSEQRQRLQRVLARLSRRQDSTTSYSDRIPQPAQQSLYDWAPRQDGAPQEEQGLDQMLEGLPPTTHHDMLELLGRRQLYRQRDSHPVDRRHNDSLRSAAIMQHARTSARSPTGGTDRILRYLRNRERNGLRNEADRDDGEPVAAAPPTTGDTDYRQIHNLNRSAWQSQQASLQTSRNSDSAAEQDARRGNDTRARVDAYRRGYLAENPALQSFSSPSHLPPSLESAVKYLDTLRACSSYEDALLAAIDHGLALKVFFSDNYHDFMTTLHRCTPPAVSSLLHPGAIFEGTQNTASSRNNEPSTVRPALPNSSIYSPDSPTSFDATRPWLSHTPIAPPSFANRRIDNNGNYKSFQDRWPVKVKLHAVDYEKMTVAGVMEAYDVPTYSSSVEPSFTSSSLPADFQLTATLHDDPSSVSSPVSKRTFPITTFLEGQIIDLNTHSFLTPSVEHGQSAESQQHRTHGIPSRRPHSQTVSFPPTSAITDAANWRNLPPFNAMSSDEDVARALLSRSSMEDIMSNWIFMRWKERCFIHSKSDPCPRHEHSPTGVMPLGEGDDQDTGHGLTISGFYYVSLRRSDGRIDGLYFDTKTSPYQHLKLTSKGSGVHGVWHFK